MTTATVPWSYDPRTGLFYRYLRNEHGQYAIEWRHSS